MSTAFKPIERSVKALIENGQPSLAGKVGGDLAYVQGQGIYVFVAQVPGAGSADEVQGSWAVDVDVFAPTWSSAIEQSLALEALFVSTRGFASDGQIIDRVYVNATAAERPWDDEVTFRIGGTYVFTARRAG